jgi:hypothetical protein
MLLVAQKISSADILCPLQNRSKDLDYINYDIQRVDHSAVEKQKLISSFIRHKGRQRAVHSQ